MSLIDKLTAETQPLLDAAYSIAEKISVHDELVVQTKIITEATQKVVNLLTEGNADVPNPLSPRLDSLGGKLKAEVVTLVKNRRDALDKGDGMTAMRDLEHVANAYESIKKLIREIREDAAQPIPGVNPPEELLPKPVKSAVVDDSGSRATDKYENITMTLGGSIKPNSPYVPPPVKEEPAYVPTPTPAKLPTVIPPKESNTGSISISSPSKSSSSDNVSSYTSNPNIPAWQQKLLAKKKLSDDLSPAKKPATTSYTSTPAASSSPAKWQAPKEEKKVEPPKPVEAPKPVHVEPPKPVHVEPPKPVHVEPPPPVYVEPPKPVTVEVKSEPVHVEEPVTLTFNPPPKKEEPAPPKEEPKTIEVVSQTPIVVQESSAGKPVVFKVDTRSTTEEKEIKADKPKVTNEVKLTQTSVPAAKPTIAKVNESGSALSPNLQKTIGLGRMSGVKTLSVTLAATSAAIDKCNEAAHGSTIRWVSLKIDKEQLDLVGSGDVSSNPQADLDAMKATAKEGEALYFFFRYKDAGTAQWALVSWIPESAPVKQRMIYASSTESTKVMIGAERVDKLATFNNQNQFKWDEFSTAPIKLKNERDFLAEENDGALPFSNLELAKRQVEREERQARQEMGTKATAASGFHTVAFPLDPKAEDAIRGLSAGAHTWVHLSLDAAFKVIELRGTSNPSAVSALAELLHKTEPQFYLYNYKNNVPVLIYMCPEKGPTVKNKMVYTTCKSTLADSILALGVSDVKKLDIRAPDELTASELDDAYVTRAAFKPSESGGGDGGYVAPKPSGAGRYGGVPLGGMGGMGGIGAMVANKAALKKVNQ